MRFFFSVQSKKSAHQGIRAPKPDGEEVAASRWDKTVDFHLVV